MGIEIKFYKLDTFKKQVDANCIDLDSEFVDFNYKVASLIFCHFWRSISPAETRKIFRNMLCQFFFAGADILSEKNPYFGKHLFCKTRTDYAYKLRVQDFATGKNLSFNQCSEQESFAFFLRKVIL